MARQFNLDKFSFVTPRKVRTAQRLAAFEGRLIDSPRLDKSKPYNLHERGDRVDEYGRKDHERDDHR